MYVKHRSGLGTRYLDDTRRLNHRGNRGEVREEQVEGQKKLERAYWGNMKRRRGQGCQSRPTLAPRSSIATRPASLQGTRAYPRLPRQRQAGRTIGHCDWVQACGIRLESMPWRSTRGLGRAIIGSLAGHQAKHGEDVPANFKGLEICRRDSSDFDLIRESLD